jgi:hypothetical protein
LSIEETAPTVATANRRFSLVAFRLTIVPLGGRFSIEKRQSQIGNPQSSQALAKCAKLRPVFSASGGKQQPGNCLLARCLARQAQHMPLVGQEVLLQAQDAALSGFLHSIVFLRTY